MFTDETLLSLADAAKRTPGRPHASSIWRWCRRGVRARNGERIKLEHVRYGSRVFTSVEALRRFGEQMARADADHFDSVDEPHPPKHDRPRQRTAHAEAAAVQAANELLDADGF